VAVRVPDHPVALALLDQADRPVAAPSANRSGRPSPTTAQHVMAELGRRVDVIVDGGPCPVGVESTVVDARGSHPIVLREGSITREDLGIGATATTEVARLAASPGTRYAHYAPRCALVLEAAGAAATKAQELRDAGYLVGMVSTEAPPSGIVEVARFEDAVDLAKQLYGALRSAEDEALDVVVVEEVASIGVGRAVMDRLRRAAAGARLDT
jgi:L-threonylcarbamoyladenylate synthase